MAGNLNAYTNLPQRGLVHAMLAMAHTHKSGEQVACLVALTSLIKSVPTVTYCRELPSVGLSPDVFLTSC